MLDSRSTTAVFENVIRHIREVLQRELGHNTAKYSESSKQLFLQLFRVRSCSEKEDDSTCNFKLVMLS
jgi:hypothetical protein